MSSGKSATGDEPRPVYDCQPCGACCRNPAFNREHGLVDYVQVFPADQLFKMKGLRASLTQKNDEGEWHMRMTPTGLCVALTGEPGQHTACSIYALRPNVCRKVQPGDPKCIDARREHGFTV